ncbi:MAG: hypothetical protein WC054_04665 [Candidatus Nanopelagicales bacterium]
MNLTAKLLTVGTAAIAIGTLAAAPAAAAPAPASATTAVESGPAFFSKKGVEMNVVNDSNTTQSPQSFWIREWQSGNFTWITRGEVKPGESRTFSGNEDAIDDKELRIFYNFEDYRQNVGSYTEIDASNPRTSSPNISVGGINKWFLEGTRHQWEEQGVRYVAERHGDSSKFKVFTMKITR